MNPSKKIAELRKLFGMTQADLAEKLNIGQSTVTAWECGERNPGRRNIEQLSKIFHTDINTLYGKETDIGPKEFSDWLINVKKYTVTDYAGNTISADEIAEELSDYLVNIKRGDNTYDNER